MTRILKSLGRIVLHRAGGLRVVRSLNRRGLRILMYHRFQPDTPGLRETLEARCAWMRREYRPISLTDAARAWRNGDPLPPNALAVTVDDGYRDFYDVAYPIFAAHGIPVTMYVVTDFLDGRCWLWADQIKHAFLNARADSVEVPPAAGSALAFRLDSHAAREAASLRVTEAAKALRDADRLALVQALPQLLKVTLPDSPPPQYAPLDWEQAREMAVNGIDFGAHTRSHPILSRVAGDAELREEIEGSKLRIEAELARPARHFCYPNGRQEDIGDRTVAVVRQSGFETAVVTDEGLNFPGADPYRLKRLPADPAYSELFFQEYVAGLRAR
jgi:peptidoglycan/xylan/chitin deacetylase (PgdA/CDA1 family)